MFFCLILPVVAVIATLLPQALAAPSPKCSIKWNGDTVIGLLEGGDVCRYTVRYGSAQRWNESVPSTGAASSNGLMGSSGAKPQCNQSPAAVDGSALPPGCPQQGQFPPASMSEDCLYIVLYVPAGSDRLPIYVWLHGGSFYEGSASNPGMDGAVLARKGVAVAVMQYRLGMLGLLPLPALGVDDPNFAVRDVLLGLRSIKGNANGFSGDGDKVTIGGQSSGAHLIRALWGVPAANGLFHRVILQSDPVDYPLSSPSMTNSIASMAAALPQFKGLTAAQLLTMPLGTLLAGQVSLALAAPSITGVPFAEPIRPTAGTLTIPIDPNLSLFRSLTHTTLPGAAPSNMPLLITNTKDEGGSIIARLLFPNPVPLSDGAAAHAAWTRGVTALVTSGASLASFSALPAYALPLEDTANEDALRDTLVRIATDGAWRCVAREAAAAWSSFGGQAYVGEFTAKAATYAYNLRTPYCGASSTVCHQDDIYTTFGTAPSPSSAGQALQSEVTDYWANFIKTGQPGGGWAPYTATNQGAAGVIALGGGSPPECPAGFWGNQVQWDWQVYAFPHL